MWQVLSGGERSEKYARLSDVDRVAIVQILRDTKKGLPDYFRPWSRLAPGPNAFTRRYDSLP
jgi:hypothetical protein